MRRKPIYAARWYVVEHPAGEVCPDGTVNVYAGPTVRYLMSGLGARSRTSYLDVVGEYVPVASDKFRLENGRFAEYRPIVDLPAAQAWLAEHPYQRAQINPCPQN